MNFEAWDNAIVAQVFGYRTAQNGYDLTITRAPGSCCADDAQEPDDTRATARTIARKLAVGDSVMRGATNELRARGFRVNTTVSRQLRPMAAQWRFSASTSLGWQWPSPVVAIPPTQSR